MKWIDFDYLLARMEKREHLAFSEFEDAMRDFVISWLRVFGLPEDTVAIETPRCLLALGILAVQRRAEIKPGHAIAWFKRQTRSQVLHYWLKMDELSCPPPRISARLVRKFTLRLDGSRRAYNRAARKLGVSPGWLRCRHLQNKKWSAAQASSPMPVIIDRFW